MRGRGFTVLAAALAAALVAGCTPATGTDPVAGSRAGRRGERVVTTIAEAFLSPMTPADNIDSPAAWRAPDGALWLIATAKRHRQAGGLRRQHRAAPA